MNILIKQLREADWSELAKIRLKALKSDPAVFGSNYERESKFGESDWRSWLDTDSSAIFMIYENGMPIGMTSVSVDRNDQSGKTAILWGSWIESGTRLKGISRIMYESRINWGKRHPAIERIIVSHRASNLSSKYANQKHGFVLTGVTEKIWPDGVSEDEFHYELKISPLKPSS